MSKKNKNADETTELKESEINDKIPQTGGADFKRIFIAVAICAGVLLILKLAGF